MYIKLGMFSPRLKREGGATCRLLSKQAGRIYEGMCEWVWSHVNEGPIHPSPKYESITPYPS